MYPQDRRPKKSDIIEYVTTYSMARGMYKHFIEEMNTLSDNGYVTSGSMSIATNREGNVFHYQLMSKCSIKKSVS